MSSGITIDAKELEEKIIKHLDKVLNEAVLKIPYLGGDIYFWELIH